MGSPDVLILGSGAAGLSCALRLAQQGHVVTVVSKGELSSGSTLWAQGGISAVLDKNDSLADHVRDTLTAGAGLCDERAVKFTVERGPACIRWLIEQGVEFTYDEDDSASPQLHLTREGGHSHRRVVHAADATGRAIETTLASLVAAHPNIRVLEHTVAVDLITGPSGSAAPRKVQGAYLYHRRSGQVSAEPAKAVVLATGGANMVYLYSSNPHGASGDGIAMAWRAGCRVSNMEFMQFHPTCLFHKDSRSFLISEALRGEGALLKLPGSGERFMPRFDQRAELAPRDIVARAIDYEMKRLGLEFVHLDITHKPADFTKRHFPSIYAHCLELGLNITRDPIPVVPSAHFTCGGVQTDLQARTDVDGLYAVGEVASTGLHGANRLASNSLLECLAFAEAATADLHHRLPAWPVPSALKPWDESRVTDSDEDVVVTHNWLELRRFMWDYVGIVRTDKRLQRAQHRIELLQDEIQEYYGNYKISADLIELRNLVTVADLIVRSALSRKESRGLHYTLDYPKTLSAARPTVLPGRS